MSDVQDAPIGEQGVTIMTGTGWEFWGLKFSWLLIMMVTSIIFLVVQIWSHGNRRSVHVDRMAGDEGDA